VAYLQVVTTIDSADKAEALARALVEERLVACLQILGPVRSVYRWDGAVQLSQEWLCVGKTTTERFDALAAAIKRLHPYDVPEIVATPIVNGSSDYLTWVTAETTIPAANA
jgi:periplasmic divalent cation tolerance protein